MIVVTRIHGKSLSSILNIESINDFVKSCPFATKIICCVRRTYEYSFSLVIFDIGWS